MYFIFGIILLNIILFYILKDIKRYLFVGSIITIVSGYLIIIIGYIFRLYLKRKISYINISVITDFLLIKNNNNALILILIGSVELIIYVLLIIIKKKEELINNSSIRSSSRIHFGI